MAISSIAILGGDLRQCYTAEYLHSLGWQITCYHTPNFPYAPEIRLADTLPEALAQSSMVLAPTPLSKDGSCLFQADTNAPPCPLASLWEHLKQDQTLAAYALPENITTLLRQKGCPTLLISQSEAFTQENAQLTAEGLLSELIQKTPFSLSSACVLLLGYGCCGSAIAHLIQPICRSIYVFEQDAEKCTQAESYGVCPVGIEDYPIVLPQCSIVINTVPSQILTSAHLQKLPSSCHIFDIASAPFGFSDSITETFQIPYFRLPGIPGRYAPASSGQAIGRIIERMTDYVL